MAKAIDGAISVLVKMMDNKEHTFSDILKLCPNVNRANFFLIMSTLQSQGYVSKNVENDFYGMPKSKFKITEEGILLINKSITSLAIKKGK